MGVISISAEVHCDGKNCDATAISDDVSAQNVSYCGNESAEIIVYAPENWITIQKYILTHYYCPNCAKKIKK